VKRFEYKSAEADREKKKKSADTVETVQELTETFPSHA
jgi:hypothetical protein